MGATLGETLAINSHMDSVVLLQVEVARLADGRLLVVKSTTLGRVSPAYPFSTEIGDCAVPGGVGARLNP